MSGALNQVNPLLIPQVTSLPSDRARVERGGKVESKEGAEFQKILSSELDLGHLTNETLRPPLKFSQHASQRLQSRKIAMDDALMGKLNKAIDQAEAKGVDDTLVLTDSGAFIVNVKNRTVVTALDRNALAGNVFTNIDGAVVI